MTRFHYSEVFKANAVRRMSMGEPVPALAEELGLNATMLYRWRRKMGTQSPVSKPTPTPTPTSTPAARRPQDWSLDEKIAAVVESMSLTEEALGGFLRQRGLHRATLDEWRASVLRGARSELGGAPARTKKADAADVRRIRQLERELERKDKALAEAAALLILQKKMRLLLGGADDDTGPKNGQ